MRYALLVLSPPDSGSSSRQALEFAKALGRAKHNVASVFFFDAGALTALTACESSADEEDLRKEWQALGEDGGIPLFACVASAQRFGVGDGRNLEERCLPGFAIAGLGELIEASSIADRLMTFGD
ncbi:sulfurtransferase complex subunit TusD [Congregibacter litoralis]|uniref:Sulfur relay protein TusD/DsrE n=1 Tax=Congregibacter litoralis KT71 TaxID=314285 RepID=A4A8D1_9GAMM|nr:sulfurtransferase complex subunit TusD [Congregibacter litoralis]EAQ97926.1 sulfur relay protein TusD/DsrE [Congregibacter litoralis KT71]